MTGFILIRGGGDVATGVALRLFHAGFRVVITELPSPVAVRRTVAFAEAVYEGAWTVEKVTARRIDAPGQIPEALEKGEVPVLVDPELDLLRNKTVASSALIALVDARLTKMPPGTLPIPFRIPDGARPSDGPLVLGLGPGFTAGFNCHAVIETMRGHTLGRAYWRGSAMADTNEPEGDPRRVLRAPASGTIHPHAQIAQRVEAGQILAEVRTMGTPRFVVSPFAGILRGMIHPGLDVAEGLKVGDVDERSDPSLCYLVSDKALAVGGGALEAILAWQHVASQDSRITANGGQ